MPSNESSGPVDADIPSDSDGDTDADGSVIDAELFLLVPILLLSAVYAYEAGSYRSDARLIPQATGILTLVLTVIVLARKLYPILGDRGRSNSTREVPDAGGDPVGAIRRYAVRTYRSDSGFTIGSTFVFLAVTAAIGLIATAPVFTYVYLRRFGFSNVVSIALSLVTVGYVYAVMTSLNLQRYLGGIFF